MDIGIMVGRLPDTCGPGGNKETFENGGLMYQQRWSEIRKWKYARSKELDTISCVCQSC